MVGTMNDTMGLGLGMNTLPASSMGHYSRSTDSDGGSRMTFSTTSESPADVGADAGIKGNEKSGVYVRSANDRRPNRHGTQRRGGSGVNVTQEQIDRVVAQMGDAWKDKDVLRSHDDLTSFVAYCVENPTQRFWQALRNWSGAVSIYMETRDCTFDTFGVERTATTAQRGSEEVCGE